MDEMKPCPCCGCNNIETEEWSFPEDTGRVRCSNCCLSISRDGLPQAIFAWNTRTVKVCDENCDYKIHSEAVSKLESCNTCHAGVDCHFSPGAGNMCRINCPLWVPKVSDGPLIIPKYTPAHRTHVYKKNAPALLAAPCGYVGLDHGESNCPGCGARIIREEGVDDDA